MRKIQAEARRLIQLTITNVTTGLHFSWDGNQYSAKLSVSQLSKVLNRIGAKDNETQPKGTRGKTFLQMAREIFSNSDNTCWAWSSDLHGLVEIILLCQKIPEPVVESEITISPFASGEVAKQKPDRRLAKAYDLASEMFGIPPDRFEEKHLSYVLEILKESNQLQKAVSARDFLASGKSAKDYLEDVAAGVTTSSAGFNTLPQEVADLRAKAVEDPAEIAKKHTEKES